MFKKMYNQDFYQSQSKQETKLRCDYFLRQQEISEIAKQNNHNGFPQLWIVTGY